MLRRLREQGSLVLQRYTPQTSSEADTLLERALAIEDSGWKGRQGTSLARWPGMAEYVRRMCSLLLPRRELEFVFLESNGEAICFQMLWNAKGTLHAYKGSYDERFQHYSPGSLLIHELLREETKAQHCRFYDCIGPNTPALAIWGGTTYPTSQLTVARRQWLSRALLFTYLHCRRPVRSRADAVPVPGMPKRNIESIPSVAENCPL
jgi:hypothetical protein